MRIALYAGTFVKNKDGVSKTLFELVDSIEKAGHTLKIWSSDISKEDAKELGVIKLPSLPIALYPDYRIGFTGLNTVRQLDDFKPDLIHFSTPDLVGRRFLLYGRKRGIPVVGVYHTDFPSYLEYYHSSIFKGLFWWGLRWFYNRCDAIFAPTKQIAIKLEEHGIHGAVVWPRGIHSERYNPSFRDERLREEWGLKDRVAVLYSGRFVWYKDLKVITDVYSMFSRHDPGRVVFVLLGSGPVERELKRLMPNAIFPGYLTGEALSRAYASCDVFLFPSSTETFGNVVLEAMASGLPCVVADKGGCMEIVNVSGGGLVSHTKDTNSFYENLLKLINDVDVYKECKKKCLEFSKAQSWEQINRIILDEYERLVNE